MAIPLASESAISWPFSIDSLGNVGKTTSQEKIWQDRVFSTIGTVRGQRILRSSYGTDISAASWDTIDTMTSAVEQEVIAAFEREFSTLKLEEVRVEFIEANNALNIEVSYTLPDLRSATTRVAIVYTDKEALIKEVNL
jgi:phage baseplate assembly protein W